ncbi:GPI anchored, partial [Fusarium albosuccineum]
MPSFVTSLLSYNFDPQPLVAEVLGVNATAATCLLNCPSGIDGNIC